MPVTPDPTPTEVLAGAGAQGGRLTLVRGEFLRYLKSVVPGVVELVNTRANGSPSKGVRKPAAFYVAGVPIDAKGFPAFIVGLSVSSGTGAPRQNARGMTLSLYIVDKPVTGREEADDLLDLADLTDMATLHLQGSHCTPDGVQVWNSFKAESLSSLPLEWDEYAGVRIDYTVSAKGLNNWPQG